jgi:hypothetical protein
MEVQALSALDELAERASTQALTSTLDRRGEIETLWHGLDH